MGRIRFSTGVEFIWCQTHYRVRRNLPQYLVEVANLALRQNKTVEHVVLTQALIDGELQFLQEGQSLPNKQFPPDLSDLKEAGRNLIYFRLEVIRPLLLEPLTIERIQKRILAVRQFQAEGEMMMSPLSQPSVYRWIKNYQISNRDARALLRRDDLRGGKGKKRTHPDVEIIINQVLEELFSNATRCSINDIRDEVYRCIAFENKTRAQDDQIPKPSRATIARRTKEVDYEGYITAKRGRKAAQIEMSQSGKFEMPTEALEVVQIDHTKLDIILVDPDDGLPIGRPIGTATIDLATRNLHGLYIGFEPASYLTAMEALYHGILPKTGTKEKYDLAGDWKCYGIPQRLVSDNGPEFVGKDLEDACAQLGIVYEPNKKGSPWQNTFKERAWRTYATQYVHTLPGTTFSNIIQRGEYASLKHCCLTLEQFERGFYRYIVDIYSQDLHRGLGDIPARVWERLTKENFCPYVPDNHEDFLVALGRIEHRTIQRMGIRFKNIFYNSDELIPLRTKGKSGQKFKFKYHPGNLSSIHVYDPENQSYIEVPSTNPEYTENLSLWKHQFILDSLNEKQVKPDYAKLGEAKNKIRQEVEKAMQKTKKTRTRAKLERLRKSGDTPSLRKRSEARESEPIAPNNLPAKESSELEDMPDSKLKGLDSTQIDSLNWDDLTSGGWSHGQIDSD